MQIAAAGDRGLMLTLPGAPAARLRAIAGGVRTIGGVFAAIIGHDSIYVIGTTDRDAIARIAESATESATVIATRHRVEVSFAPEYALDLTDLITHAGVSRETIIDRVSRLTLTVRYLGFLPGWAYLDGWPQDLALPRRPTSRNRVPGGSFAIANAMAGFYPTDCPGGWNILGRTDAIPRFEPGDEVHVVPVERPMHFVPRTVTPERLPVEILAPGQMTTVVHGRDWPKLERGEPAGGAFDVEAAAAANRAVGNADDAPLFECVLVGPRFRVRDAGRVAFCGASLQPRVWKARAGEEIDIGRIRDGFRGYVAVEFPEHRHAERSEASRRRDPSPSARLRVTVISGPHDSPPLPTEWEVTPHLNRVGVRLRPLQPFEFRPPAELPSCGMQFGTLQWHADGSIVAMGPDHPVTGGYLQPATVRSSELWKLGQLAPGDRIKLIE